MASHYNPKPNIDPLADLPRLSEDALGPCLHCGKFMLATGAPVFYRVTIESCGIDARAVQDHVGLAMQLGGGPDGLVLAGVMGRGVKPVVVMDSGTANVCLQCLCSASVAGALDACLSGES